jgi:hypothetical protein
VISVGIDKAVAAEIGIFNTWTNTSLAFKSVCRTSNQCAANVPQSLQSHEFFEVFEGTSEPSVRADVVGKRLIHLGRRHFLRCCKPYLTSRRSQVRVLHCPPFKSITYRVYCLVAAHNDSQLSFPNQTFPRSRSSDIAGLPGRGGNRRRPARY